MNTPSVSTPAVGGASARQSDRNSSESTAAAGGFAALLARLEPADTEAESALPASAAAGGVLQAEDIVDAEGPDPMLLAALGLSPLPPLPSANGPALPSADGWANPTPDGGDAPPLEAASVRTHTRPGAPQFPAAGVDAAARPLPAPTSTVPLTAAALNPLAASATTSSFSFDVVATVQALASGSIPVTAIGPANTLDDPLTDLPTLPGQPVAALDSRASALKPAALPSELAAASGPRRAAPAGQGDARQDTTPLPPALPPAAPRAAADFSSSQAAASTSSLAMAPDPALTVGTEAAPEAQLAGPGRADALLSIRRGALEANSGALPQAAAAGAERAELAASLRESLLPLSAALPVPRLEPGSPQFSATLGQQVVWMASQQVGRAELKLSPDELGPLEISLEMNGDEIRAEFASRSAEVRSLLETQVPRLRELLAEQGFSLADAQVGQERAAYQDAPQQREAFGGGQARVVDSEAERSTPTAAPLRARLGLVDDYA